MIPLPGLDKLFAQVSALAGQSEWGPGLQAEIKQLIEQKLKTLLAEMDLVTREEFDAQTAVLHRTREQLEQLQKLLAELEAEGKPQA